MRLVIFGASGPTGQRAVCNALDEGLHVTAVTRRPDEYPLAAPRLRVHGGDVKDPTSVRAAVEGQDAVISTVGVHYTRAKVDTYSAGTINIVDAMRSANVRRLIAVTALGADSGTAHPDGPLILRRLIVPVSYRLGKRMYEDMARMEEILRGSDLDWLILRPSKLFDSEQVNEYELSESPPRGMFTSRADLAHVLVQQALHPTHHRVALDLVTPANMPRSPDLLLRATRGLGIRGGAPGERVVRRPW